MKSFITLVPDGFELLTNAPVNSFSVMSERFLGSISTNMGLKDFINLGQLRIVGSR